ncbi:MAG TPA: ATP-binding protein [Egibacteraceae bacterium]|nr:ATP-binding protein [Egibacteraceae bacterium]
MSRTESLRRTELPPQPVSARKARRFVSECLARWGLGHLDADAALLVSEVVTNGLRHAGTRMALEVLRTGDGVRVEVRDGSRSPCVRRRAHPDSVDGRGLELVAAVADDWGQRRRGEGKVVWFELARR